MRRGLIMQGAVLGGLALLVIPFRGTQKRRMMDEAFLAAAANPEVSSHLVHRGEPYDDAVEDFYRQCSDESSSDERV
jgi:hypothetical protein